MTHDPQITSRFSLSQTSRMSFAVAGCAFTAAVIGLLINHFMSGWMAAGGMAGVGLFYLAVGLLNLGQSSPVYSEDGPLSTTSAHRLSDASNVHDVVIERVLETTNDVLGEKNLTKAGH